MRSCVNGWADDPVNPVDLGGMKVGDPWATDPATSSGDSGGGTVPIQVPPQTESGGARQSGSITGSTDEDPGSNMAILTLPKPVGNIPPLGSVLASPSNASAMLIKPPQPPTLLPGSSNTLVEPRASYSGPPQLARKTWTKVPQSWYDLPLKEPSDIRDLIANANLAGVQGVYVDSPSFATPVGAWNPTPFSLTGLPQCFTLGTDNQLLVEQAKQWNFKHLTANFSASLSPLLANVIYLRAGTQWEMSIPLSTTGTITDIQLSFRNNSASYGEFTGAASGSIPAISFTGSFTGPIPLLITLKKVGHAHLAFRVIDYTGKYSMFGLECIIVN